LIPLFYDTFLLSFLLSFLSSESHSSLDSILALFITIQSQKLRFSKWDGVLALTGGKIDRLTAAQQTLSVAHVLAWKVVVAARALKLLDLDDLKALVSVTLAKEDKIDKIAANIKLDVAEEGGKELMQSKKRQGKNAGVDVNLEDDGAVNIKKFTAFATGLEHLLRRRLAAPTPSGAVIVVTDRRATVEVYIHDLIHTRITCKLNSFSLIPLFSNALKKHFLYIHICAHIG
jgi:hypothetical protein